MKSIQKILDNRLLKFTTHFIFGVISMYLMFLGFLAFLFMIAFVTSSQEFTNSLPKIQTTISEWAKSDIASQRNLIRGMADGFKMILVLPAILSLIVNGAGNLTGYLIYLHERYLDKKDSNNTK